MSMPFAAWAKQVQADMEVVLDRHLPAPSTSPAKLHQAMRYAALDGGKRVRPLLVFAAGAVFDAPTDAHGARGCCRRDDSCVFAGA
jgi:farnesyl diphosphate synthase